MRVFISLTTISSRIDNVHQVVSSLLRQRIPIECTSIQISLYISNEPYLLDEGISSVPASLNDLLESANNKWNSTKKFSIEFCPNTGPHRKYIHTLPLMNEEDILITVDDDTLYPEYAIQSLVEANLKHDCVTSMRGRKIAISNNEIKTYRSWKKNMNELTMPSLLNVGTGKDGIAYRISHLHPNVSNVKAALEFASCADDLWLKMHSLLYGLPTKILSRDLSQSFPDIISRNGRNDSLYSEFNRDGGNDKTMISLNQYLMSEFQTTWLDLVREF
jgi:hypothetical protein